MREYILFPQKRLKLAENKLFLASSFEDLIPFFVHNAFIGIHFNFDSQSLVKRASATPGGVLKSDVILGLLFKKSLCGKNAFFKIFQEQFDWKKILQVNETATHSQASRRDSEVLQLPKDQSPENPSLSDDGSTHFGDTTLDSKALKSTEGQAENEGLMQYFHSKELESYLRNIANQPGNNLNTMGVKLELYVPEKEWKESDKETKDVLFTLITLMKEEIDKRILKWSAIRMAEAKNNQQKDQNHDENGKMSWGSGLSLIKFTVSEDSKQKKPSPAKWSFNLKGINQNPEFSFFRLSHLRNESRLGSQCLSVSSDSSVEEEKPPTHPLSTEWQSLKAEITQLNKNECRSIQNAIPQSASSLSLPLYLINTRDCFTYDPIVKTEKFMFGDRQVTKMRFYFDPENSPPNFKHFFSNSPDLFTGGTIYENIFTHEELNEIESKIHETECDYFNGKFLPFTGQTSFSGSRVKRTKFFFNARYLWSKTQLNEPFSFVGAGIRTDVSKAPSWMSEKIERKLVQAGVVPPNFLNSFALNVYHDGKEGLAQHFDDAVRFKQPIFTMRLFSDSRLSFGSQLYGFCNGAFAVPLARGCIAVMEGTHFP